MNRPPTHARQLVLLTAISSCVLLLLGCGAGRGHPPHKRAALLGNLTMSVPAGWHLRRLQFDCGLHVQGPQIVLADLTEPRLRSMHHVGIGPGSCTTQWDMSGLGARYAMIDIDTAGLGFLRLGSSSPLTSFPLRPRQFRFADETCECSLRSGAIFTNREDYLIRMWLGANASASERNQLVGLVRSIRPTVRDSTR